MSRIEKGCPVNICTVLLLSQWQHYQNDHCQQLYFCCRCYTGHVDISRHNAEERAGRYSMAQYGFVKIKLGLKVMIKLTQRAGRYTHMTRCVLQEKFCFNKATTI